MKKILRETIFILMLSLLISLIYTAASPSGTILLKKAFRLSAADMSETDKFDRRGTLQDEKK